MENMNLRIARMRKRICQYELSNKTGISQGRISLFERGHRQPTKDQARKIAEALQVNTDEIFPDLLSQWKTRKDEKVEYGRNEI